MSLLQNLLHSEYLKAKAFTLEQCELLAKTANLSICFGNSEKPGEILIKTLDRRGFSKQQYHHLISSLNRFRPQSKIAILIANEKYEHLSKLATPSIDCDSLALSLKTLGFIVVTIKNTKAEDLKLILRVISNLIIEDSYCFIFYAGHGCQLCNTKCMLGTDCPVSNIQFEHCVTENYVLKELEKCKLELCILIMDMCRVNLDRASNPEIYTAMSLTEDYNVHKNMLIAYSTQGSAAAYEVLQIELSTTVDNDVTYELKTGDSARIVPGASQYVNALCTRIMENYDVSTLLDKVHGDVENSMKKQKPIKLQCGVDKRYLFDATAGDASAFLDDLRVTLSSYKQYCNIIC